MAAPGFPDVGSERSLRLTAAPSTLTGRGSRSSAHVGREALPRASESSPAAPDDRCELSAGEHRALEGAIPERERSRRE